MTATTMTTHEPVGLVVGGDRITTSSVPHHEHIYPATGRPNAIVALAGASEIDRAVACAWEAHREWSGLTVDRRRDLLIDLADVVHEHLDELAALNVHDYAVPFRSRVPPYCWNGFCVISPAMPTSHSG